MSRCNFQAVQKLMYVSRGARFRSASQSNHPEIVCAHRVSQPHELGRQKIIPRNLSIVPSPCSTSPFSLHALSILSPSLSSLSIPHSSYLFLPPSLSRSFLASSAPSLSHRTLTLFLDRRPGSIVFACVRGQGARYFRPSPTRNAVPGGVFRHTAMDDGSGGGGGGPSPALPRRSFTPRT